MKSQRDMFKWLAMAVALAVFLAFALVLPSASAQDEIPPTPTETAIEPTPFPTEEPTEIPPETTPQPTEMPTEQGESVQPFSAFASSVPMPPDSDCSDGQCVFWVKARTDDAGLHPACTYSTIYNEIYLGECANRQGIVSGFRFPNVTIPAGMIIQEAYIEFTVDGPYTDELNVAFYGEASGNANPFSTSSRPSNRPLTVSSSTWSIPSSDRWELGQLRDGPDLTAIVQEIVNRSDWNSGNALAIIVKNAGLASGTNRHRRVIGYDRPVWYPGTENAARLVIRLGYDCTDYKDTLSNIGQAVFAEVESDQEFCGNNFDANDLITLPPGEDAFQRFERLASDARYEVDFTTMLWDEYIPIKGASAGRIFLNGVKELHSKVVDPNNADYYSEGVRVRILIGLRVNSLDSVAFLESPLPWKDRRQDMHARVFEDIRELDIPLVDTNWKVEVALYNAPSSTTYSHVKLMIVDGKTVITGGYNMQYTYLNGGSRRDMGVEVSGPIALRALTVFDNLWSGAILCENVTDGDCTESSVTLQRHPMLNTPIATGDDIIFSLYRDHDDKSADNAIVAAINAANSNVNIMQNRFINTFILPMPYARAILDVLKKDEIDKVNLLVSGELGDLSLNKIGICSLKKRLANEDPSKLQYFEARSLKPSVHTKALSIDNSFVIVGSQNFDVSAWGDYDGNLNLAEYSLAIDSSHGVNTAASEFNSYFANEWDTANKVTCKADNASLQSEVDQAETGSIIFVPAGVYTESVLINKPITLVGANNQTIIQPVEDQPAFRIISSDVVIANMKISGSDGYGIELIDSSPSSLKNIQIYRVVFEDNAQGGILVQGLIPGSPMNYTIENSTFIGGGSGVTINMLETQAEKSFIRNNIFFGQLRFPIEILSANDSHVEYSFNLFDNCDLGFCSVYWRDGALNALSNQHDNLFDLNPLFSNPEHGAYQLSSSSPAIDAGDPSMFHDLYFDGNNDEIVQIDIGAFEYVPVVNLPPVVSAGADQASELGNSTTINALYTDEDNIEDHSARIDWGDGVVEDVVASATGPNEGEVIGTHTYPNLGTYIVEICVTDPHGSVGCDTTNLTVTQRFSFTGFFQPVDNQPILNTVKAGSAIPIKFSLNGYQGLNIFFAGYPTSAAVACGSSVEDAIEKTVTAGGSSLSYAAITDQYTYVWKTNKAWANTCRTFVLRLSDGSYYRANFKFK